NLVGGVIRGVTAGCRLPNVSDTTGGATLPAINPSGRSVTVDPTSTDPTDMRAVAFFDVFATEDKNIIVSLASTGGRVAVTTASPHNFGVGQWVGIHG